MEDRSNQSDSELIVDAINNNLPGCDISISLFMSALESYRVDKCLRPFPPMFVYNGNKDVDRLRATCKSIPSLSSILENPNLCSNELKNLLVWLLYRKDKLQLRKTSFSTIKLPFPIKKSFVPHHLYELVYSERSERSWQRLKGDKSSFFLYHGSQLDCFHSILTVGLQQSFGSTKEHLYGEGIYLTTEISLSMIYAPFSNTWSNNMMGSKLSIIAFCEVIDDPNKVKCIDNKYKERSRNEGSMSGEIPDKYFVVTDSDMVRVKYLFVYKSESMKKIQSWLYDNIFLILLTVYVLLLLCLGLFHNINWTRLKRSLYRTIGFQERER